MTEPFLHTTRGSGSFFSLSSKVISIECIGFALSYALTWLESSPQRGIFVLMLFNTLRACTYCHSHPGDECGDPRGKRVGDQTVGGRAAFERYCSAWFTIYTYLVT